MSPTAVYALSCALSCIVGFWLSRASSRVERQALQADVERAQQGEAEWAKLAVHRQAVIAALEARAVEDAARIEELRAQVESGRLSLTLHFRRVHAGEDLLERITPMALSEAQEAARMEVAGEIVMAHYRIEAMDEALRGVQASLRGSLDECAELRAQLEALKAGSTS